MQKLGALDANFLYSETESMPNHIASVQRFELPAGMSSGDFIARLKSHLRSRIHLVPYMYRKLQFVPGDYDHPVWVDVDDVDMDRHVSEIAVAAPGEPHQLECAVARIHETHMDRDRPLWKIHVLTGLADGSIAFYNQVHHAAIDGMGGQAATMLLMDETPDHQPVVRPVSAGTGGPADPTNLLQMTLQNLFQYQLGTLGRALNSLEAMRRLMQRAVDPARHFGAIGERVPRTRFNAHIGKTRSYAVGEFEFDPVRDMGRQLACTVNDVFMAVCSGALRRYLQRHNELPAFGLIAGCPVSLRTNGDKGAGNRVTMMKVNLATHIEDPRLRLLAIHHSAEVAKEVTADLSHGFEPNVSLPGLPALMSMAAATAEAARIADLTAPAINLVISNVPGPNNPLYCNGARMLTHYPVSIPAHGAALNITVQSYARRLYFGVTACANVLPDAWQLRDDMLDAFLEMQQMLRPPKTAPLHARPLGHSGLATEPPGVETTHSSPLTRVA